VDCPVSQRGALRPGDEVHGPAVIEEYGSNTLLHAGDLATVHELGHLIVLVAPLVAGGQA
jgi:N-methylhydantoinase A/oxoprolinase/acetone carboxylase beta subunit